MVDPLLSIVVPSVNGWSDLEGALAALERNRSDLPLEVLVVDRCGEEVRGNVAREFPWVRMLPVDQSATIPQMRALAFEAASAPSVAVIEDHVRVPDGWASDMLEARSAARVVGGGVRNAATDTVLDWAAFLCEYSHLLPPLAAGEVEWVTGNNTVYERSLLLQHADVIRGGGWENLLHDAIRAGGVPLVSRPDIVVDHRKHYTFMEYFTQRYLYARSYAGARVAGAPLLRRVAFGVAAFSLPPLLLGRTVSRCLSKEVPRALVWRSLPYTALFVCAWGAGEIVGYWFGAGDSLQKVC